MTVPVVPSDQGHLQPSAELGRRLAIASLLMVPALLVSFAVAFFAGTALQDAFGLAEDESLREAGAWGVVAGVVLIALIVFPQVVGIIFGVRARRLGERRRATVGIVVNAAIAAYLGLVNIIGLVV